MYIQIIKGWMKEQNDFLFLKFTTNFFKFNKILRIQNKIKRQNISFVVFNVKKKTGAVFMCFVHQKLIFQNLFKLRPSETILVFSNKNSSDNFISTEK